jgi:hypothetical protein
MRRSLWVAVVGGLIVVVTGVACASPRPLPLRDRLIKQGELAGFRPQSEARAYRTAEAWVGSGPHPSGEQMSAIARLQREGFVAALSELLDRETAGGGGESWVVQLGSAASARAELKVDLDKAKRDEPSFSAFSVPAIPSARGFRVFVNGEVGENIFFADGPFLYLVGQGGPSGDKTLPTRAGLIKAVTTLYRRVHGHPAR